MLILQPVALQFYFLSTNDIIQILRKEALLENEPVFTLVYSSRHFFSVQVSLFICVKPVLSKIEIPQNTCPNSSLECKSCQLKRFVALFFFFFLQIVGKVVQWAGDVLLRSRTGDSGILSRSLSLSKGTYSSERQSLNKVVVSVPGRR